MPIAQQCTDTSVSLGQKYLQHNAAAFACSRTCGCIHQRQVRWHSGLAAVRNNKLSDSLPTYRVTDFVERCIGTWLACLSQDLCRKSIKHNASSGKAWERLGSILEREQAYKVEPEIACAA